MTNKYYREEINHPRPKFKGPPRKIFKLVDEEGNRAPDSIIERSRKNNIIYPIKEEKNTVPRTKRARGGRAGYKHGGAAKRGHGCEIKS